jgi:hypothetical protein
METNNADDDGHWPVLSIFEATPAGVRACARVWKTNGRRFMTAAGPLVPSILFNWQVCVRA